jgi:hypothetical protein
MTRTSLTEIPLILMQTYYCLPTPQMLVTQILGRPPGSLVLPRVVMADGTLLCGSEIDIVRAKPVAGHRRPLSHRRRGRLS